MKLKVFHISISSEKKIQLFAVDESNQMRIIKLDLNNAGDISVSHVSKPLNYLGFNSAIAATA